MAILLNYQSGVHEVSGSKRGICFRRWSYFLAQSSDPWRSLIPKRGKVWSLISLLVIPDPEAAIPDPEGCNSRSRGCDPRSWGCDSRSRGCDPWSHIPRYDPEVKIWKNPDFSGIGGGTLEVAMNLRLWLNGQTFSSSIVFVAHNLGWLNEQTMFDQTSSPDNAFCVLPLKLWRARPQIRFLIGCFFPFELALFAFAHEAKVGWKCLI